MTYGETPIALLLVCAATERDVRQVAARAQSAR
jgi:hypothetical protein